MTDSFCGCWCSVALTSFGINRMSLKTPRLNTQLPRLGVGGGFSFECFNGTRQYMALGPMQDVFVSLGHLLRIGALSNSVAHGFTRWVVAGSMSKKDNEAPKPKTYQQKKQQKSSWDSCKLTISKTLHMEKGHTQGPRQGLQVPHQPLVLVLSGDHLRNWMSMRCNPE